MNVTITYDISTCVDCPYSAVRPQGKYCRLLANTPNTNPYILPEGRNSIISRCPLLGETK